MREGETLRTEHGYLETSQAGQVVACHVTHATSKHPRGIALVVPPVGYSYFSSYLTVRCLAEEMARAGITAVRIDLPGTGNSPGDGWATTLQDWQEATQSVAEKLRRSTSAPFVLAGFQFGGLLAIGAHQEGDHLILWEPVLSGRRFERSLRLIGVPAPANSSHGGLTVGGSPFSRPLLDAIRLLSATIPSDGVVVTSGTDPTISTTTGQTIDVVRLTDRSPLEMPAEEADIPLGPLRETVAHVAARLDASNASDRSGGRPPPAVPLRQRCDDLDGTTQRFVSLTRANLVGVMGTPATWSADPSRTTVVFLNSGSEMSAGPGRAWVEYADSIQRAGVRTLRVDWSGWGESPLSPAGPGRPYDAHCLGETEDLVEELTRDGSKVVLAGLCAGAWVGLEVARRSRRDRGCDAGLAGVIALNPQIYWRPGDPVDALLSTTRDRRTRVREREARGGRNGIWSALDFFGLLNREGRWLRALDRNGIPILLLFADADDGLEYLQNRQARRLSRVVTRGSVSVVEVPDIDHSMHRSWFRDRVDQHINEFLRDRIVRRDPRTRISGRSSR